jgi:type VI secretion system secreted protein Hcp
MPMPCYLILKGQKQGDIKGSTKVKGHEDTILIQAIEHTIEIPSSPQTGLPTGKRVHRPMTLTKEIDKSSPKLFQALTSGEYMTSVELQYYRISPKGTEEKYYTVKLANAILTSIRAWTPNCLVPGNQQMGHMEDLSFTYEKVTWTFEPDGIEGEDSWLEPKA